LAERSHKQELEAKLQSFQLDWQPEPAGGRVSLTPRRESSEQSMEELSAWLARPLEGALEAFNGIFPPQPQLQLELRGGQVVNAATGETYDVAAVAERLPWKPQTWRGDWDYPPYMPPHCYVVMGKCDYADWDVLSYAIAKHPTSYRAYFRGYQSPMRYWELGNYRYWRTALGVQMLTAALWIPWNIRAEWMLEPGRSGRRNGEPLRGSHKPMAGR
jgi:hypothetical protein